MMNIFLLCNICIKVMNPAGNKPCCNLDYDFLFSLLVFGIITLQEVTMR